MKLLQPFTEGFLPAQKRRRFRLQHRKGHSRANCNHNIENDNGELSFHGLFRDQSATCHGERRPKRYFPIEEILSWCPARNAIIYEDVGQTLIIHMDSITGNSVVKGEQTYVSFMIDVSSSLFPYSTQSFMYNSRCESALEYIGIAM